MAYSEDSSWKIYETYFRSGQVEAAVSALPLFGGALNNAMILRTNNHKGNYKYNSFIQKPDVISRRVTTGANAYAAQSINALTEDESIGVKISRKYQVGFTESSLNKLGTTPEAIAMQIGRDYEASKLKDMLFTSLLAVETALANTANVTFGSNAVTTTPSNLLSTFAKFGDAAGDVVAIVSHSTPWFDFNSQLLSDKVDQVYSGLLQSFAVPSFSRRWGVVDATALSDSGSPTTYNTLGLTAGAVVCEESEPENFLFDRVSGLENITRIFQAEYAFTLSVRGYKYNTAKGANPTDATLGLSDTWTQVATSDKHLAGVHLTTKAA